MDLNERQIDALMFFKSKNEIVNIEYAKRFSVSDKTARRDLVELVEKKLLNRVGKGKGTRYISIMSDKPIESPINVR